MVMVGQANMFDEEVATQARDEGIAEAEAHAEPTWQEAAVNAVLQAARDNLRFLVDDVWPYMPKGVFTHENRAMGAAIRQAEKMGYIMATQDYQLSMRITSHRNPRRVWRSLVYRGD